MIDDSAGGYCQCEDCQQPCEACRAEPFETCRFGCLGWAVDNELVEL